MKNNNIEGIFNGIAHLIDKIGDLAEKGEQFKRAMGEIEKNTGGVVKAHCNVQVGLGSKPTRSPQRPEKTDKQNPTSETREPIADLFDESDHFLIIVEMPGISINEIQLDLQGKQLILRAENQHKRYYKELNLPVSCQRENIKLVCNNGILEIICPKN